MSIVNLIGISLSPGNRFLTYGTPQNISVIGIEQNSSTSLNSNIIPNNMIRFSSSDPDIVEVSSTGQISAFEGVTGRSTISASVLGFTSSIICFVGTSPGLAMGVLGLTYAE